MGTATWTQPTDRSVGYIVKNADWQSDVVNNLLALQAYEDKTTAKDVNTSTSLTDLLNGEVTIPANALGAHGLYVGVAICDFLNNTGAGTSTPQLQIKLGGTTLIDAPAAWGTNNATTSATRRSLLISFEIKMLAATNSLEARMRATLGGASANTGLGGSVAGDGAWVTAGAVTVDTTVACAVVLNVANFANSASYSTRLLSYHGKVFPT